MKTIEMSSLFGFIWQLNDGPLYVYSDEAKEVDLMELDRTDPLDRVIFDDLTARHAQVYQRVDTRVGTGVHKYAPVVVVDGREVLDHSHAFEDVFGSMVPM
jgi:hypothetical protein